MLFPMEGHPADPSRLAFQMCETGEKVSFGQLDARANQVAHVLRSCGVGPGEHVAVLMTNQRQFLEACFGMDRAGVYYTTISTQYTGCRFKSSYHRRLFRFNLQN